LQRLGNSLEKLAKKIRDSDLYTPKHTRWSSFTFW
jgi:hypothetical protein